MKIRNRHREGRKGQAAIEFIIVSIVMFFFLFFLLSLSILFVVSDYMEYATFMAARTYKSGALNPAIQERRAREVFEQYVSNVDGIARNFRINFTDAEPGNPRTGGAVATYQIDTFYMPPFFIKSGIVPPSRIELTTESFLGREPSVEECLFYFRGFTQRIGINIPERLLQMMEDNGC